MISLGYDDVSLGEALGGLSGNFKSSGPGGEYCRVCRITTGEKHEKERQALNDDATPNKPQADVRMAISSQNLIGRGTTDGDLDVVAVPYVFRYLCAELASMGIAVSLEVK